MPEEDKYIKISFPSMTSSEINLTSCTVEKLQEITLNHDSSNIPKSQIVCNNKIDSATVKLTLDSTSHCSSLNLDNFEKIYFDSSTLNGQYLKKTPLELNSFTIDGLKLLINELSKAVKEISNQLVQLLVENDALQQESDARNIAIEQLLKMTVKVTENELKPVQMSIILPSEECEDV